MNKNPTMENADKNLSKILNPNPKKSKGCYAKYWKAQEEVLKGVFEE